jgi:long-subunit acyl-CoA synthetase (AMP-forming)
MSELSCVATLVPPDAPRFGTVGKPLPGVALKLADDGELLVRGGIVMAGYRGQPEKTAETIDSDGWLHTGDIATIDDDGYVRIVDRKKELIINAAGKNMSPANIEQQLKMGSPLIGQAIAIGDRRPYNVALIVLDPDAASAFAREHGLADASTPAMAADPAVQTEVTAGVERANAHLSRVEQIKRFKILPVDWQPAGDELTPTMKLKRKPIAAKYAAEIEALYAH